MGQFYKTSKPTFVEDFMYTPPWKMYQEIIAKKDKAVDDELLKAAELEGTLNFDTLDFDKEKATEKKLYYKNKIDELSNQIKKDPENYQKYSQDIYKVQKELLEDFTKGEIAAMTGDYSGMQKFTKEHEKFKQKDPTRYNAGLNSFYEEAKLKRKQNGYVPVWDSEQLMETIDFRKGFVDFVSKKKPNTEAYASSGAKGGFIFKNKGSKTELSEAEVQELMKEYIESTPNILEYERQSQRIGLGTDFQSLLDFSKSFAYKQEKADSSKTRDPLTMLYAREASQKRIEEIKQKNRKALHDYKEGSGDVYNGELQTAPLRKLLGDANISNMYKRTGHTPKTLNPNNTVIFGTPALVGAGIINPKQEKAITERVNYFSKNLDNFGNKQIVFVPDKNIKYKSTRSDYTSTLKEGKTYILTAKKAKDLGIIKEIVPNSGQPFYIDDNYNGVRYTFKTPDGQILNGSLMPTFREVKDKDGNKIQVGSHPSVKEGLEILSIE